MIPDILCDDHDVKEFLAANRVDPLTYRMRRAIPEDRTELIIEKIGDYYELEGLI